MVCCCFRSNKGYQEKVADTESSASMQLNTSKKDSLSKQEEMIIIPRVPDKSACVKMFESNETNFDSDEEKVDGKENGSFALLQTSPLSDEKSECEIDTFFF